MNKKDHLEAFLSKVKTQMKVGDPQSAVKLLKNGLRHFKKEPSYFFYLGLAYEKMGDYEKARDAFNRSLDIEITIEGLYGKALVQLDEGQTIRAVKTYNRIHELDERYEPLDTRASEEEVARALRKVEMHHIEGVPWEGEESEPLVAESVEKGRRRMERTKTWCPDCGVDTVHHLVVVKNLPHSSQCLSCGRVLYFRNKAQ